MIVIAFKTDTPQAELYVLRNGKVVVKKIWHAHRALLESIHVSLEQVLTDAKYTLQDVQGIVVFTGGGSFTGLRIGVTVANALAASLQVPVVGAIGYEWLKQGIVSVSKAKVGVFVTPQYGAPATTTTPRK